MKTMFVAIVSASLVSLPAMAKKVKMPARAQACFACHGPQGKSTNPMYPVLAGQKKADLVTKMTEYKNGTRKKMGPQGQVMVGQAKMLSDKDIQELAAYFSSVK
jgi:cytochrome c553